jgi:hypothetical protein
VNAPQLPNGTYRFGSGDEAQLKSKVDRRTLVGINFDTYQPFGMDKLWLSTGKSDIQSSILPSWLTYDLPKAAGCIEADNLGGFTFVDNKKAEKLVDPSSILLEAAGPMPPSYIKVILHAAIEALLICNAVLRAPNEELFSQFFKDNLHRGTIMLIFQKARDFLVRILNRHQPGAAAPPGTLPIKIFRLILEDEKTNITAFVNSTESIFVFTPVFFQQDETWGQCYYERERRDHTLGAFEVCAHKLHTGRTKGAILLHEVVHYVSHQSWPKVVESISVPRTNQFTKSLPRKLGYDVPAIDFAQPHRPRENKIVDDIAKEMRRPKEKAATYGYRSCRLLASLYYGSAASLFNASNYNHYAGRVLGEFLYNLWTEETGQTEKKAELFAKLKAQDRADDKINEQFAERAGAQWPAPLATLTAQPSGKPAQKSASDTSKEESQAILQRWKAKEK